MINKELKGLLGGIGSYASSFIYQKALDYTRNKNHDKDYPNLLVYNLPCTSLIGENYETKESMLEIEQGLDILRNAGCKKIWIGCNSVHSFINNINNTYVIDWTKQLLTNLSTDNVLVLCSRHTRNTGLYEKNSNKNIYYPSDTEQKELDTMILKAIKNKIHQQEIDQLRRTLSKYNKMNIAIACTELSLVYSRINHKYINVVDSCEYIAYEISQ